jgi:putative SOS response-associated peptidase YedK
LPDTVQINRRFNVAPGDEVLAITTDRHGARRPEMLRWGFLAPWAQTPDTAAKMINARAETVAEKPAYRAAFERFRCLILADGFYEWGQSDRTGPKRAFHVTRRDRQPFAFAGLWSVWHRGESDQIRSCTIITVAPNSLVAPLHDRMPAILAPDDEQRWLQDGTPEPVLLELLHGLPAAQTAVRPVGPAVNDARFDGPQCLDDPEPALF